MKLLLFTLTLTLVFNNSDAFTVFSKPSSSLPILSSKTSPNTLLYAKKKKSKTTGKGFGKAPPPETPKSNPSSSNNQPSIFNEAPTTTTQSGGLTSIESSSKPKIDIDIDPSLSTDERNKEILKQQFGLRSFEEKQSDIKAAEKMAEQREKFQKIKQMKDEEFDIFMVLPPPLVKAIDLFLKTGLAVTTVLFILAGVGITAEAWSVATGNNLPENVDDFIVNVIEPNFTPGLFVLLAFSVSLGVFATAQLGSGSSAYKEQ